MKSTTLTDEQFRLVATYARLMRSICKVPASDHDDQYQDVFVHVLTYLHKFDPALASFSTWAYQCAFAATKNFMDKKKSGKRRILSTSTSLDIYADDGLADMFHPAEKTTEADTDAYLDAREELRREYDLLAFLPGLDFDFRYEKRRPSYTDRTIDKKINNLLNSSKEQN